MKHFRMCLAAITRSPRRVPARASLWCATAMRYVFGWPPVERPGSRCVQRNSCCSANCRRLCRVPCNELMFKFDPSQNVLLIVGQTCTPVGPDPDISALTDFLSSTFEPTGQSSRALWTLQCSTCFEYQIVSRVARASATCSSKLTSF